MDDDDRTRRAILLLWNLTGALTGIGVMTITVMQLAHLAGLCTGVGAGLSTVIVLWQLRRPRGYVGLAETLGPLSPL